MAMDNLLPLAAQGKDFKRPVIIAGPCSAETPEQVLTTAQELAAHGVGIFRAGIWKPRTKPGGFEGIGEPALEWLKEVKHSTGMLIAVEVATHAHVEAALRHEVDILWIGARTTGNPFAVQEIADSLRHTPEIPVLVKNPMNPDIELWTGAMERLHNAGIRRIGAIHRGFSVYGERMYRNRIPILKDALGYMICEIIDQIENDTHTLFIGKLIEADVLNEEEPMSYGYYQEHKDELLKVTTEEGKTAWVCTICGYVYYGEELKEDFKCPVCGVGRDLFQKK